MKQFDEPEDKVSCFFALATAHAARHEWPRNWCVSLCVSVMTSRNRFVPARMLFCPYVGVFQTTSLFRNFSSALHRKCKFDVLWTGCRHMIPLMDDLSHLVSSVSFVQSCFMVLAPSCSFPILLFSSPACCPQGQPVPHPSVGNPIQQPRGVPSRPLHPQGGARTYGLPAYRPQRAGLQPGRHQAARIHLPPMAGTAAGDAPAV